MAAVMHAWGPDASAGLWQRFWSSRDPALRQQLVEQYLDFARIMAGRLFAMRVHAGLEFGDFLQFAREGLLQAVDRYEDGHGAKFETYAASRINGAILDGIRSYSEVQEQAAVRKRVLARRAAELAAPAPPTGDYDALFCHLAEMAVGLAVGFLLDDSGMFLADEPAYPDNAYAGVELRQLRQRLHAMLDQLTERQRQVLRHHYLQQMPFEEIAAMLGLSKGRVSQLHKEALAALRKRMLQDDPINLSF
jgi:RNA polymerase sigma factor FliA